MKKILFLVNGYGLGNSTRIHSLIQCIDQKHQIDIFGYGNSVKYFKQVSRIQNIFQSLPLEYGLKKGKIDAFRTIGKLFSNFKAIYKSRQDLRKILQSQVYNLIVADSNFSAVFLKNRPKLISINNADRVIESARQIKKRFYLTSWLLEMADYIYNRIAPDLVISPFFEPYKNTGKFQHTALMVRKEFLTARPHILPKRHHVLIIPSGAPLNASLSLKHDKTDYDISVIGDQIITLGKIKKHDRVFNTSPLMKQATIAVVNGGLSSISEALAMAKPMIVIPLEGHLEQRINADWIQNNNLGLISSWEKLKESVHEMIKNYDSFKKHLIEYKYINGAQQGADLILREVENEAVR
ncbi:MAG: glycosyltransferase [Oligoflexia bacterium]|nr:glycosyltransferase [Oligoflexia bacterium]